jgi:hypothetical protein
MCKLLKAMFHSISPGWAKAVIFATLTLLALLAMANILRLEHQIQSGQWGIDFLWRSLHLLAGHSDPYATYLAESRAGINLRGTPNYPVAGLIPLLPLGLLPEATARWTWLVLNLGFASGIIFLLQRKHPLPDWIAASALLAFTASAPLRIALFNSQTPLYVLFTFLLAIHFTPKRPWLSGLLLAISLMKYSITLPLMIWFGLRRERISSVMWAAGWHIFLILLASLWVRADFMDILLGPLRLTAAGGVAMNWVASDLFSILHHAGIRSIAVPAALALGFMAASYLMLLKRSFTHFFAGFRLENSRCECLQLAYLTTLSCILFFHMSYDHLILVIPLWHGLGCITHHTNERTHGALIVLLVLTLWLPREAWNLTSHVFEPLTRLGALWWQLGLSELVRFSALLSLFMALLVHLQRKMPQLMHRSAQR